MPDPPGLPPSPHDNWSLVRRRAPRRRPRRLLRWVALGAAGAAAAALWMTAGRDTAPDHHDLATGREEPGDISGVQTFDVPERHHTADPVDYPQHPPVGGPHTEEWHNCGIYRAEEDVVVETAVHNLEHGAVWITHRPHLPPEEIAALHRLYREGDYVLISPLADLGAPIVASAWGKQLGLDSAEDPRLGEFLHTYELGPQTPGHGGPCSGGLGGGGER